MATLTFRDQRAFWAGAVSYLRTPTMRTIIYSGDALDQLTSSSWAVFRSLLNALRYRLFFALTISLLTRFLMRCVEKMSCESITDKHGSLKFISPFICRIIACVNSSSALHTKSCSLLMLKSPFNRGLQKLLRNSLEEIERVDIQHWLHQLHLHL